MVTSYDSTAFVIVTITTEVDQSPLQTRHHYNPSTRQRGFARQEGINYTTFAHWVTKAPQRAVGPGPIKFAELRLPLPSVEERLEVRLPDGTVLSGGRVADVVALVLALRA